MPQPMERLLERVDAALCQLDSLSFAVQYEQTNSGQLGQTSQDGARRVTALMCKDGRFRVERKEPIARPDDFEKFFSDPQGGDGAALVICDGTRVTEWISSENVWTCYPVPADSGASPFRGLLVKDTATNADCLSWLRPDNELTRNIRDGFPDATSGSTDQVTNGDRLCDRIRIKQTLGELPMLMSATYELFVDANTHLPVRQTITVAPKLLIVTIGKQIQDTQFLDVRTNVPTPDALFHFDPPAGSVFIPPDDDRFRRSVAVGQPAPALTLPTADGTPFQIADCRGKQAVLLSFWTTSCAPCLREMPTLIRLHDEFAGKGLAVVGVSVGGTKSQLASFLKKRPLPYTVLHDTAHASRDNYFVIGVPHTVLINKDGTVVRVWQGWYGSDEETQIRDELAKLGITRADAP